VRTQRDPADHMAVRMTAFSLTLLLVPVLALVWVRWVWQEAKDPAVSGFVLACRTGLLVAAGLLAYLALRLLGAAVAAIARELEDLDRRSHPWRW
jgi:Zn-dependent protease with chaperone function